MSNSARNKQFGGMAGVALHLLAYATLALGSLFASPGLAGSGMCIRAEITQSVRLPHGEVLPPGTLKLCQEELSPVTHLHKTFLDGKVVGVLMSRGRISEARPSDAPVIVFGRGEDGQLALVGYLLPGHPDSVTFSFVRPRGGGRADEKVNQPALLMAAAFD